MYRRRDLLWELLRRVVPAVKECAAIALLKRGRLLRSWSFGRGQACLLLANANAYGRLHRLQLQRPLVGRFVFRGGEVGIHNGCKVDVCEGILAAWGRVSRRDRVRFHVVRRARGGGKVALSEITGTG